MTERRSKLWRFWLAGATPKDAEQLRDKVANVSYSIASWQEEDNLAGYFHFAVCKRLVTLQRGILPGRGVVWSLACSKSDWINSSAHLSSNNMAFRTGAMCYNRQKRSPSRKMATLRLLELSCWQAAQQCYGCVAAGDQQHSCRSSSVSSGRANRHNRLASFLSTDAWTALLTRKDLMALLEAVKPTLSMRELAAMLEVCKSRVFEEAVAMSEGDIS